MDFALTGKVAVITGGSEGIGACTAQLLALEGCDVAIGARREEPLQATASAIEQESGRVPLALSTDVTSAEDCAGLVRATIERFGGIDILINNAGASSAQPFEQLDDEVWQADLDLKLFGAVRMARQCLPSMRERGGGRVINVLNIGAKQPGPGSMPTTVSRAAGLALTKALSRDVAADNVLVNAVCVGSIKSAQWGRFREQRAPEATEAEFLAQVGRNIPLGRIGETEEAANLIVFLASGAASYITGTAINVDGGASGTW